MLTETPRGPFVCLCLGFHCVLFYEKILGRFPRFTHKFPVHRLEDVSQAQRARTVHRTLRKNLCDLQTAVAGLQSHPHA